MRVLATIAFSFAAGLFLVLLLPWSGWYLWAAGLALAALGLYLWGRTQKRFRRGRLILWPLAASLVYFTAYQAVVQQPVLDGSAARRRRLPAPSAPGRGRRSEALR